MIVPTDATHDVQVSIRGIIDQIAALSRKVDKLAGDTGGATAQDITDLKRALSVVAQRPTTLDFLDVFRASGPAHALGYVPDPGATPGTIRYLREDSSWSESGVGSLFQRGGAFVAPSGALAVVVWRTPFPCTVLNVRGFRIGGTGATVNARINGTSTHLSSDLSVSSTGTWMDGGAVQNTSYVAGDYLELLLQSVSGSPTQVVIQVDFRRTG